MWIQQWVMIAQKINTGSIVWPFTSSDFTTQAGSPTWSSNQVTFPWASTIKIKNINTNNSNIVFIQWYFTWVTNDPNEDLAWIILTNQSSLPSVWYQTTYSAKITSRSYNWWQYRLYWWAWTYNTYNNDTININKWTDVKITYNTSNNQIKYWYWNWSAWTQMWTTQTINILNWWTLYFHLFYDVILINLWTTTFNNLYFGSVLSDYTTHYPS